MKIKTNTFTILWIIALTTIVVFFFLRLFIPDLSIFVTPDFGQSDLFQLNYPAKYSLYQALHTNALPLWNKNIGTGFPQLAEGQIGTFNLTNLVLYRMLPFVVAINIGYIVIFLTSALGTYAYLSFLKFKKVTSFFGAVLFAFSGFFITHISHINLIQASSYIPWIFLLCHMYIRNRKPLLVLLFAFVLSQQFLSGFPQITFITLCGVGLLYIFNLTKSDVIKPKTFIVPIIAACIFIGLIAVQLLPSKELLDISTRKDGFTPSQAAKFSFPYKHFFGFINPNILGSPADGTYPFFTRIDNSVYWENTGYIGIVPLLFVVVAFLKKKKSKDNTFYMLLLFVSALLMTGKYSPIYFIFSFPPFTLFRVPSRFIILFVWSLVILSSYGFEVFYEALRTRIKSQQLLSTMLVVVVVSALGQLLWYGYTYNPVGKADDWLMKPQLLHKLSHSERYYTVGSGIVWNEYFTKNGWKSTSPYLSMRNFMQPNVNIFFDTPSFQVYPILTTNRYAIVSSLIERNVAVNDDLTSLDVTKQGEKLLSMNNVHTIVSAYPNNELQYVGGAKESDSNIYLYNIPATIPKAYFVYDYEIIQTAEEFEEKITDQKYDPLLKVFLEKELPSYTVKKMPPKGNGTISILKDSNDTVQLKTSNSSDAILVLSDLYYPDWKATIDGLTSEIYPANVSQRAIMVPKGDHVVTFTYNPRSVQKGAYISASTYLLLAILIFAGIFSARYRRHVSIV